MSRGLLTALACTALAILAGCGSSSSPSSSTSASKPSSTRTANTIGAGKVGSGLKATTTPKFASPPANAPVRSGTVRIAYRNIAIAPDTLRVKVGTTIRWTNFDAIDHNVTSQGDRSKTGQQKFASKDFGEGGTFEVKARTPGVIHYLCTIHPTSMNGTIEVVE
jgi:plastocyanin